MLSILFSRTYRDNIEEFNVVEDPPTAFDVRHTDSYITDTLSKEIISSIDKSTVIGPNLIMSPVLGPIPPQTLSGGTKTLIMINKHRDMIFNATHCGDNCSEYILKIAKDSDITINLRYIMEFDFSEGDRIHIINDDSIVDNYRDYATKAFYFLED